MVQEMVVGDLNINLTSECQYQVCAVAEEPTYAEDDPTFRQFIARTAVLVDTNRAVHAQFHSGHVLVVFNLCPDLVRDGFYPGDQW
jgi:hypothetical protein